MDLLRILGIDYDSYYSVMKMKKNDRLWKRVFIALRIVSENHRFHLKYEDKSRRAVRPRARNE
jgi:hypothetical protein